MSQTQGPQTPGPAIAKEVDQIVNLNNRLHEWYGHLSSRRVDLVGDYAGQELFLLEGDSLLLHIFSDPQLDFNEGFQLLHAVYSVEKFLSGLVQRHCNFHIVFLEHHRELCIPRSVIGARRSKYLLARTVVRRHLNVNLQKIHSTIRVQSFNSQQDPRFQEYLETTGVYFVMCHDGANLGQSVDDVITVKTHQESSIDANSKDRRRRTRFRSLILTLITRGYNVALINGLDFIDTKVMTMVVEASRKAPAQHEIQRGLEQENVLVPEDVENIDQTTSIELMLSRLKLQERGPDNPIGLLECQCSTSNSLRSALTERELTAIVALGQMLQQDRVTEVVATKFLLGVVIVGAVSLASRRYSLAKGKNISEKEIDSLIADLSTSLTRLLSDKRWTDSMDQNGLLCDVSDLVDGRLLRSLLSMSDQSHFGDRLIERFEQLARSLCAACGTHLKAPQRSVTDDPVPMGANVSLSNDMTILPFSSPVFDKHLSSINVRVSASNNPDRLSGRIHQEISHWHNAKRRLDPKQSQVTPASEKEKFRALRRNQFFMAEMQAYAASLTNAAGKQLEPEIVTVSAASYPDAKDLKPAIEKPQNGKSAPNRKGGGKKNMLEEIAANKAAKDSENDERTFSAWRTFRKNLESERSLRSKYSKIKIYLRESPKAKQNVLQAEAELHLLCILYEIYRLLCKDDKSQKKVSSQQEVFGIAALIWDTSRRLIGLENLTRTIAERTSLILKNLELPDPSIVFPKTDRKLAYDPELLLNNDNDLKIGMSLTKFQLQHCGPYLDRNLDSAPDSRVPFEPDGWQRKVLDELDAHHGVFVVAPTSAGKTFISFYAMEKILRSNDEGVLVYVAPTKALVNQIAAEIQARFKKTYKHAGKSTWAIHTRDYRINNPSGCQILVTVPHILQIMLLAPNNAKSWSPKVRYIIFDEIHSIGHAEDGVIWEQLLLLAPCPIIALSATVGNPEMFNSWLESTQRSCGNEMTMIKHQHRYSELRKFAYVPPKKFAFRGLAERASFATLGLDELDGLAFVHPIASLVNKSRGIPDDLSLEARDCLSLLNAMKTHATADYPIDSKLEPTTRNFPNVIRKADVIDWERDLKTQLKLWMVNKDSPFDEVLHELSNSMEANVSIDREVSKGDITEQDDDFVDIDSDNLSATTLPLLCKLHQRNALPAILFNYDRHRCEKIAQAVIAQLEDAENHWKQTSLSWKNKVSGYEKWKLEKEKLGNRKAAKVLPKKKGKVDLDDDPSSKMDKLQDAASEEANPYINFDPDAPVDGFHFAAKHLASAEELSRYLWQMKRRGLASWLTTALQRGIGVHHAGMNRKYRQVVEMLFRSGYLRVVIATGTLALGINMPCATVVFSGDSIFLTALNFRQGAGRAGRRGFDLLGNVVFQGISHGKICRLLSSRLPDLNGHFPLTTTLVLRLCMLLHESGDSAYAVRAINSLLSQPRLYLDGPAFRDQTLHHLRFSIEYLRRQDLLSSQGAPINFAGLTSHLYFTENSSFALNALIKGGYFHTLCSEIGSKESHVLRTLMVVLAHLFGRQPCREADAEYIEDIVKRSPSIVFLPPLPSQAASVLREHNRDTLQVFTTYVRTFIDQHVEIDDNTLPLTGMEVGGVEKDSVLAGSLPATSIRSSFVALSGHDDRFETISDLCRNVRSGVFLEEAVVPHLDVFPDESKTPLNAYLYDFYMHGDINALERANRVKKSDVWFVLNDFSLVLATIIASLANFLKLPESDLSLLDVIGEGDETNNAEDDKFAIDSSTDTESIATSVATADTGRTSLTSTASTNSKPKPTKKKVVDSWEDSEDEDEGDSENANGSVEDDLSKEELERGFLNIYKAMTKLRAEFDTKFRKIFA